MIAVSPPRILVGIATYNERDNLETLVASIREHLSTASVLIIDDNSPDGTGKLADSLAAADDRITVIHRPGKLGLGTAILAGMRYAADNNYDLFVNMDADFSHHPRYLPALIDEMAESDVAIGSRYVAGGGTRNWPLSRRLMSKTINTLVRLLMRIPAKDTSGGFRCFRVDCLREVDFDAIVSSGYSFHEELLYRCWRAGCRIGETPIVFENRKNGSSKVNIKEMIRSFSILLYLGLRTSAGIRH